jgi:hypothetical protein
VIYDIFGETEKDELEDTEKTEESKTETLQK